MDKLEWKERMYHETSTSDGVWVESSRAVVRADGRLLRRVVSVQRREVDVLQRRLESAEDSERKYPRKIKLTLEVSLTHHSVALVWKHSCEGKG